MSYGPPRGGRTTLYVAGFPPDMRAKELAYEFERMGPLLRCDIPAIKNPNSKPYAFIEYEDPRDAEDAHRRMHNMRFGDYTIGIQFAKNAPSSSWRYDGGRGPPPRARSPPRRYDDYRRGDDRDRDYRRDDPRDRDYRRDDRSDRDYRRDDRDYRRDDRDRRYRDDKDDLRNRFDDRDRGGSSRPRSISPPRSSRRGSFTRDEFDREPSRPPLGREGSRRADEVNSTDEDEKTGWE
ncbi:hypothetical protein CF327_g2709 [Tilletia walkeri]|nr:hypothetical protein CF327_g2709 [Tilletia walkeri]